MVNKVILIGNLGKDPEYRQLEGGNAMARFSLATNENYKDKNGEWQKQTEWHDIVTWGGLAEYAEKYLKKGSLIFVEGKLTHRKYTDKDNIERYATDVRALTVRLMDRREGGENMSSESPSASSSQPSSPSSINMDSADDDDLPF